MGKVIVLVCLSVHTPEGGGYLPWPGVPTLAGVVPTLAGGTYLGWGGTYLGWGGTYLGQGGTYLGWEYLLWLGGTYLGWWLPTLARGYLP